MVEPWGSLASLILFVLMCRGLWETSPEHSQTYSASDLCLLEHALTLPWVSPPAPPGSALLELAVLVAVLAVCRCVL